jgi:hypothetical protein
MTFCLPFSVFLDEDSFSMVPIIFPLSEVDISVMVLKDACAVFAVISELSLVGFPGGVLDLFDVGHELPVGSVDVLLEEGLYYASFLFDELAVVCLAFHNDRV